MYMHIATRHEMRPSSNPCCVASSLCGLCTLCKVWPCLKNVLIFKLNKTQKKFNYNWFDCGTWEGNTDLPHSTSTNTQLNLQAQLHMHAIFYLCQLSMKAVRNNDHFSIFFFPTHYLKKFLSKLLLLSLVNFTNV